MSERRDMWIARAKAMRAVCEVLRGAVEQSCGDGSAWAMQCAKLARDASSEAARLATRAAANAGGQDVRDAATQARRSARSMFWMYERERYAQKIKRGELE